jgi:hypothetical protein
MLRKAVLAVGLILLAIGAGSLLAGGRAFLPFLLWGAALVAAVQFERWRYRPSASQAAGHDGAGSADPRSAWQTTEERFIDPETGRSMQVLYNAATGERRYEPIESPGAEGGVP